jgi:eukaryotic-like serine/threonine-protein kinase
MTVAGLTYETIGNYRVVQQLGEGGMGVVCLAQHPIIGRKVAIKVLHPALSTYPDLVTRFFNEARAIHMIGHENVVEILDFGQTEGGQPYFIMEFLEGEPLSGPVARGPMDPNNVALIADQMCRALSAIHAKGIVHRDLKPQNVQLVTKADGSLQVKILDFGVAKILAAPDGVQSAKTRTGSVMGTPLYMSPEQCKGARAIDYRADIYSLGVMLFEMLAGRPPFMAEGIGELFTRHMFQPAPLLADIAQKVPVHMAAAVMRSLAKEPRDRFQSMEELRAAFAGELGQEEHPEPSAPLGMAPAVAEVLSQGVSGGPSSSPRRASVVVTRPERSWTTAALASSVAVAAFIGFLLIHKTRSAASQNVARPVSAPLVLATATAPVVPRAPNAVTLRFEAEPAGAHLFDGKGADLGETPAAVQVPRGTTAQDYAVRLAGYHDVLLEAAADADRTFRVSLERLTSPSAPSSASKRPISAYRRAKRSERPIDEDGLATPSF